MTLGLMRALAELSVPCPEKVSVVSFDDFEWAANFSPRLTTMAQPTYQIGKQAMQMLLQLMNSEKDGFEKEEAVLVLPAELCLRDSTAPPSNSL